jgi:hypothetical protein
MSGRQARMLVGGSPASSLVPNPIDESDARATSAEQLHVLVIIAGVVRQ